MTVDLIEAVRARDRERVRAILASDPAAVHARNDDGATALHYAAELGDRECVELLLDAGADLNARDARFGATPAGWAIEYLRMRGALLGTEIEDALDAIRRGDAELLERSLTRWPALADARDRDGTPLRDHAARAGGAAAELFARVHR
ncbi:MAG TPA: ankyrin repeat domain-containing protein [Thermoanaerobaculia bacterium]|jgi:ankyrin repeat protein